MNLQVMPATLVVLALVLFLLAARSRKKTGIPAGEVFYQDLPVNPSSAKPCVPTLWASPANQTAWYEPRTRPFPWS
jgi:hypothetical protein